MRATKVSVLKQWTNKVIQGDCLDLLRELPSECIDLIITDPPYGIDLIPMRGVNESVTNDGIEEARELWKSFVPEFYRLLKNDTASIIFGGKTEGWTVELLKEWFTVKDAICWYKHVWGIGRYFRPQWEIAYYIHKGKPPTLGNNAPSNVWKFDRLINPCHSCEKPIDLMEQAIIQCGRGLVLDPFVGSGPTLIAAKNLECDYIGFEIEQKFVQITKKRLAETGLSTRDERIDAKVALTFENLI